MPKPSLTKFAWLSIAASIATIGLKTLAYFLTGSVGLLSDAMESVVNLVAAIMALLMLKVAEKPPDEDHMFGHTKAEYFSSVVEGILIIVAAASIAITAVDRLMHPHAVEQAFLGLGVSVLASIVNLVVAMQLLKAGKKYHSITLEADAHHLMTDVWTSVGVLIAVAAIAVTGWQILDPIIGICVAINIVFAGVKIIRKSVMGFMDTAISQEEQEKIYSVLDKYAKDGIKYHEILTRQAAAQRFVTMHILVPGDWTVQKSHSLVEDIETDIKGAIPHISILSHIEPLEDPRSWQDITVKRSS